MASSEHSYKPPDARRRDPKQISAHPENPIPDPCRRNPVPGSNTGTHPINQEILKEKKDGPTEKGN
jgi:hypothetical protein